MLPRRERRRDVFFSRVAEEAPPEPPRRAPVAEVLRCGDQSRRGHGIDGHGVVVGVVAHHGRLAEPRAASIASFFASATHASATSADESRRPADERHVARRELEAPRCVREAPRRVRTESLADDVRRAWAAAPKRRQLRRRRPGRVRFALLRAPAAAARRPAPRHSGRDPPRPGSRRRFSRRGAGHDQRAASASTTSAARPWLVSRDAVKTARARSARSAEPTRRPFRACSRSALEALDQLRAGLGRRRRPPIERRHPGKRPRASDASRNAPRTRRVSRRTGAPATGSRSPRRRGRPHPMKAACACASSTSSRPGAAARGPTRPAGESPALRRARLHQTAGGRDHDRRRRAALREAREFGREMRGGHGA